MNDFNMIFGTGPLGKAVMRELVARGEKIKMANTSGNAEVPGTVEVVKCNAYSEEQTKFCCKGAKKVFQCAQPPYHEWKEKFPLLNSSIAAGACFAGAKLITGDNYYMYGDIGEPLVEDTTNKATTRKGIIRAQIASDLMDLHKKGNLQVCIARGADFFGPEVIASVMGSRVFPAVLQNKKCSLIGNIDVIHSYTFINDFGKAMVDLSFGEECFGQIWHVPTYSQFTTRQIVEKAFSIAGNSPQMSGMGRMMMRVGGLFLVEARETMEMMYIFEKPFVFKDTKFTNYFKYVTTPIQQALKETLDWYKDKYSTN